MQIWKLDVVVISSIGVAALLKNIKIPAFGFHPGLENFLGKDWLGISCIAGSCFEVVSTFRMLQPCLLDLTLPAHSDKRGHVA